jgi:hypothetical protein
MAACLKWISKERKINGNKTDDHIFSDIFGVCKYTHIALETHLEILKFKKQMTT